MVSMPMRSLVSRWGDPFKVKPKQNSLVWTPEAILAKLDQFYSDLGATTGDKILSEDYRMKQRDGEEVAEYAWRLDNKVRKGKTHGTELLLDEQAVDKHLRLLFWEGLSEFVKDKGRHKKDSCKTFSNLISAARYVVWSVSRLLAPPRGLERGGSWHFRLHGMVKRS